MRRTRHEADGLGDAGMLPLTIAVLTYQGERLLPACLTSIVAQRIPVPYELLVVDGPSTPPATVPTYIKHRMVRLPTAAGNINGMNECFRQAAGDWVLFVANDVRLLPRCVERLWAHRGSLCQPVLLTPQETIDNYGLRWRWPGYGSRIQTIRPYGEVLRPIPAFAATCFLLQRSVWQEVGSFDETLGVSHEDIDFSLTLRKSGYRCFVNTQAQAVHLMGQTIGRVTPGPLSPRYHVARLRVLRKHYRGVNYWARRGAVVVLDRVAQAQHG